MNTYWTHNVAYHKWILDKIGPEDTVLDVGCGDGLLVQKLAERCKQVIGLEPHAPSAEKAKERVAQVDNASILHTSFEAYEGNEPVDAMVFVASIHHMDLAVTLRKAKGLLVPGGKILIVGLARVDGIADLLVEALRVIPAKIGSLIHGEREGGQIGVPTQAPPLSLKEIREIAGEYLPNAAFRRGLYYRYRMLWKK